MRAKLLQLCLTLCDPMDCSCPGCSVQGIFQAKILEWVAMASSRGSSRPGDGTTASYVSCIGRWVLYHEQHLGSPINIYITPEISLFLFVILPSQSCLRPPAPTREPLLCFLSPSVISVLIDLLNVRSFLFSLWDSRERRIFEQKGSKIYGEILQ